MSVLDAASKRLLDADAASTRDAKRPCLLAAQHAAAQPDGEDSWRMPSSQDGGSFRKMLSSDTSAVAGGEAGSPGCSSVDTASNRSDDTSTSPVKSTAAADDQKRRYSCLRSSSSSSQPGRRVAFSNGPLPEFEDGHRPEDQGRVAKPTGVPRRSCLPSEALTRANLLAMLATCGAEFEEQNAASITRLKRRVRLSPICHVPRPYACAPPKPRCATPTAASSRPKRSAPTSPSSPAAEQPASPAVVSTAEIEAAQPIVPSQASSDQPTAPDSTADADQCCA